MARSAVLRKSITDLTRRKARAILSVLMLALAVASIGIFAVSPLVDRAMQDEVEATRLSDLSVSMRPLTLSETQLAALARIPNVEGVEARSFFDTRMYVGARRADTIVLGIRDFGRQAVDVVEIDSGTAPGAGAVLTEVQNRLQGRFEGGAGDSARVIASDGSVRRLRVTGEGSNLDAGQDVIESTIVLYATPATVADLSGEEGFSSLAFRLRDPEAVETTLLTVRRELEALPAFTGFTEFPSIRAPGDWPGREELEQISNLMVIVTLLALLSALVLIANTMTTLIGEQTGEIGAMKAIGARRRQIAAIYLRTALLLGALGTLLGGVLGVLLANAVAGFFGSELFAVETSFGVDLPVLAATIAIGLLGPALAALPAIRRALRMSVREAIEETGSVTGSQGALDWALRRVRFLPRSAQIGVRSIGRRKRRTLATVLQIGFAVATMLALLGLGTAAERTAAGAWDEHGEAFSVWSSSSKPLDDAAAPVIRATPGVESVEAVLKNEIDYDGEDAFLWGLPAATMFRHEVTDGRWYTAAEERQGAHVAVLERGLARFTGTEVGDRVRVETANGPATFRVIGIDDDLQESGTVFFVPLTTMRAVIGDADGYDYWIRTASDDHAAIDRTTTQVEDRLLAAGYQPDTEITYVAKRDEIAAFRSVMTTITVLGFLIVAISMVGLVSSMTMSVLERTREIGILRSIGARARDVRRVFGTEALALALLGWLVGVPLGYALDRLLTWLVSESIHVDLEFAFPFWNVPLALAGTVVLALLVMMPPLHRAVRFRPGEALRYA
jgi:putative ABC transport system permease protein